MNYENKNFEKWARVYDLIYGKYTVDIEFYKKEASKMKGKANLFISPYLFLKKS